MGCSLCRTCVSKQKKRTKDDDVNLDLMVLHRNVTVMGFPSRGIEAMYRNPYEDVVKYLDRKFGVDYLVINLCSEANRQYDSQDYFHGKCLLLPFPDHNACQLQDLPELVEKSQQFIFSDPGMPKGKMVVIHCKAGKGRSGLMACCLMMALYPELATAEKVMDYYGKVRTHDGKGLTVPSQRRYVSYYEQLRALSAGQMPSTIPAICLQTITVCGLWEFVKGAEVVRIRIGRYDSDQVVQFSTKANLALADGVIITEDSIANSVTIDFTRSQFGILRALKGDVRIDFLKSGTGKSPWLASLSFHTLFVKPFYGYKEIDKLYKAPVAATEGFGLGYLKVDGLAASSVDVGSVLGISDSATKTNLMEIPKALPRPSPNTDNSTFSEPSTSAGNMKDGSISDVELRTPNITPNKNRAAAYTIAVQPSSGGVIEPEDDPLL